MAEFICFNYFVSELNAVLDVTDTRLPIPTDDASVLCESLGVDPCAGCLPGDDPPTSADSYTRLMLHHNGRFEIVKVTGCEGGIPIIERGQEGTDPLKFPAGTCVQFIWTCGNIFDMIGQTADAISHGLDYNELTGKLDLLVDGEVVDTVTISGGGGGGGEVPVTDMTYDKPSNILTLDLAGGSTVTAVISPYVVSTGYDVGSEVLTIVLSDGSTHTTTIPQAVSGPDIHLNSATYDNGTRIMSLGLTDGSNYDVNLGALYGLNLTGVNFNSGDSKITFTMSDSSTLVSDLTALSEHVTGMSFSGITNVLTLNREIGSNLTADLSLLAVDTKVQSLGFDPLTRELTVYSTDGTSETVIITAPVDTYVSAISFDNPSRVLTLLMSDASIRATIIPAA